MALIDPLRAHGKQALLGAKIWEKKISPKSVGRPIKLVITMDQSSSSSSNMKPLQSRDGTGLGAINYRINLGPG